MKKEDLLRQFSLNIPAKYQPESLLRVAHLDPEKLRKAAVLILVSIARMAYPSY